MCTTRRVPAGKSGWMSAAHEDFDELVEAVAEIPFEERQARIVNGEGAMVEMLLKAPVKRCPRIGKKDLGPVRCALGRRRGRMLKAASSSGATRAWGWALHWRCTLRMWERKNGEVEVEL